MKNYNEIKNGSYQNKDEIKSNLLTEASIENDTSLEVIPTSEVAASIFNEITVSQNKLYAQIEDDDFEEDKIGKEIVSELNDARINGAFLDMSKLTLIYGRQNTTKIFAKRVISNGNNGEPVLVFLYTNGRTTPEISITMQEIMTVRFGNYGIENEQIDKYNLNQARKILRKLGERLFQYWNVDINISISRLIELLEVNYNSLKIDTGTELDIALVYSVIFKYIQSEKSRMRDEIERKSVYALQKEDMMNIASKLNLKLGELVKYLKNNYILHLQNSSVGYQCEVKGLGSCYCIRKLNKYKDENIVNLDFNAMDEI